MELKTLIITFLFLWQQLADDSQLQFLYLNFFLRILYKLIHLLIQHDWISGLNFKEMCSVHDFKVDFIFRKYSGPKNYK